MSDERRNRPSASGMERLALCPGSWNLESTLPPEPESEDAASGTRIHAALAGENVTLSHEERDTLETLDRLEMDAVRTVFGFLKDAALREHRQWFFLKGVPAFSGKPDVVYCVGTDILILDAKTGRNDTPIAANNIQLRALAVLWDDRNLYQVSSITVGILAPWQENRLTLARYDRDNLDAAREEILGVLKRAEDPNAPRVPSIEACRYCRARGVCPEARAVALALPVAETPELPTPTRTPEAFAAALTGDELSACLTRGRLFDRIHEAIRDEAKRRMTAGETIPGWTLKPGTKRTTITDPQAVFQRFAALGGTAEQFMRVVKVTNGKLESAVRDVTGAKGVSLKQTMAALVEGASEEKETNPSLEEV
mgnify:CR=1 FL=1